MLHTDPHLHGPLQNCYHSNFQASGSYTYFPISLFPSLPIHEAHEQTISKSFMSLLENDRVITTGLWPVKARNNFHPLTKTCPVRPGIYRLSRFPELHWLLSVTSELWDIQENEGLEIFGFLQVEYNSDKFSTTV
jgi:hypothetical protein